MCVFVCVCVCVCLYVGCQLAHEQDHFLFVFSKELSQEILVTKRIFSVDTVCMELVPPFGNQSQRDGVYEQILQDSKTRIPQVVLLPAYVAIHVLALCARWPLSETLSPPFNSSCFHPTGCLSTIYIYIYKERERERKIDGG